MQILSAANFNAWDAATIKRQGIRSTDLMERAAMACVSWLKEMYPVNTTFLVICGPGNNGGDGLAIARLLNNGGYGVQALLLDFGRPFSEDNNANAERLSGIGLLTIVEEGQSITSLAEETVIIDALFGTGLNRPLSGAAASFINDLNKLPNECLSIDLPSGVMADGLLENATILKAAATLTFGAWKRSLLHPETGIYAGRITLPDIGLDPEYPNSLNADWNTLDDAMARSLYRPREEFSHKGTYGTAFLIGGSYGLIGATLLAAQAAGRAGAGKVRALVPACGYQIVQTAAPEVMCHTSGERCIEKIEGWESASGIGIGPGLGNDARTVEAFQSFLTNIERPVVLDADALNILGKKRDLIKLIPKNSILTPHPKEFERMAGETANSFERVNKAQRMARELGVYIVLKDRHTCVLTPAGKGFYNLNGNAGLATGGSGDVLCGIIAGLLAQGYTPLAAAMLGVWLHGKAGDITLQDVGAMEAVVAGDILNGIGRAFGCLQH